MADVVPQIPLEFLNPRQKYALINWVVDLGLPARIGRGILQQWALAVGVDMSPGDYALIDNKLKTAPAGSSQ